MINVFRVVRIIIIEIFTINIVVNNVAPYVFNASLLYIKKKKI